MAVLLVSLSSATSSKASGRSTTARCVDRKAEALQQLADLILEVVNPPPASNVISLQASAAA
jgi:hypothetical protein